MRLVFVLASDNNFFNYGIKSISYTNKKIQCVDFTGIDKLIHKDIASKKYLVCDDVSYSIYSALFTESEIKCICIENITLHNGTVCIYENNTSLSTSKIYYRFNRIKSKLGIETTRKLPASLKKFFSQRIGNQHNFVNHA